jgi:hypothetical protein
MATLVTVDVLVGARASIAASTAAVLPALAVLTVGTSS